MPMLPAGSRLAEARTTLALLTAGVLCTFVLVSLPVFVGAMAAEFGWGEREIGWLASADMAGSCVASLCFIPFIGRLPWRRVGVAGLTVAFVGNLLSIAADGFSSLLAARFLCGLGGGLLLSTAYVGLCRSTNPDRYFGVYVFVQLSMQVLALAVFPTFVTNHGLDAIFVFLAAVALACLPLVALFPRNMPAVPAAATAPLASAVGAGDARSISAAGLLGLAAQALYFLAPAAVWGYFERIGHTFGLSLGQIGLALSIASVAAIAGALLVVALGTRAPRKPSMLIGTVLSVIAMLMLIDGSGVTPFLAAAALFNFAWNYTFPYQMGVLATLDRTGAVAIASLVVQLGGLALGPVLASFLHPERGYTTILVACIACYVVSLLMFRASERSA
jgi:predicted MFS family arabinose efflux permease